MAEYRVRARRRVPSRSATGADNGGTAAHADGLHRGSSSTTGRCTSHGRAQLRGGRRGGKMGGRDHAGAPLSHPKQGVLELTAPLWHAELYHFYGRSQTQASGKGPASPAIDGAHEQLHSVQEQQRVGGAAEAASLVRDASFLPSKMLKSLMILIVQAHFSKSNARERGDHGGAVATGAPRSPPSPVMKQI